MTKNSNLFVTCSSGDNGFTDCLVRKAGDNVELIGHNRMQFSKAEAKYLVKVIKNIIKEIEQNDS